VAGLTTAVPFDAQAVKRIHLLAGGVPRRINLLCDRALLGAYASGRANVDAGIVDKAAAEVLGHSGRGLRRPLRVPARWRLAVALGLGLVLGAALFAAASVALDAARSPVAATASQRPNGR
jgi:general secretion pathway protein A